MPQPLVLCPLQIEARSARRALGAAAVILRTGPGPKAIERALRDRLEPPGSIVVLYGTAGGLGAPVIACRAARIVDVSGRAWTPTVEPPDPEKTRGSYGEVILGVDAPVHTPAQKQDLGRRTGAGVVDCESHAFAPIAADRAWRWSVVRAVTDDDHTALPAEIPSWAAPDGRTLGGRVIASIIRRPALLGETIRLARRTSRALRAAEILLRAEVDRLTRDAGAESP